MAKRVFVIDDELEFCNTIKDYLEGTGKFEVGVLTDPRGTLEAVKAFKPNVVLLDLRMPHVGGFEICQLLNNDEETKRIPLIVVTGFTDEGDIKRAFNLGASGYIAKPVSLQELLIKIESVVSE